MMDRDGFRIYKGSVCNKERKEAIIVVSSLQLSPEVCKMESKRLRALKSPYTINYYGIYQDEPTICVFVMPHC